MPSASAKPYVYWSAMSPDEARKYILARVQANHLHDSWRRAMAARGAAAYAVCRNDDLWDGMSLGDRIGPQSNRGNRGYRSRNRWNFARAITETYCEKLTGLDAPKTQMVTTDASWEEHRAAVWHDRFVEGGYHEEQGMFGDVWDVARHGFKVTGVATGTVAARIEPDFVGRRVRCDLRSTLNTFIDPADVHQGVPLTYVDVTWENPEYLLADKDRYGDPKIRDMIWKSAQVPPDMKHGGTDCPWETPMVRVVSAWRMPFGEFKGRCAKFVDQGTIEWGDWESNTPPLAFFRMTRGLTGFWGENFIEIMLGALDAVGDVNEKVDEVMKRLSETWITVDRRSKAQGKILTAKHVAVVDYDGEFGQPPQVHHNDFIAEQYLNWQTKNLEVAHRLVGLDELHVDGATQHGSESGRAKRLEAALLPERHAKVLRAWRQWVAVDMAKLYIDSAKQISKVVPNWQVTWPGMDFDAKVSSKCLNIDHSKYSMRPYAVSEQKNTPQDRAASAQEMLDRGEISLEQYNVIVSGAYDVPKEGKRASAQRRFVSKVLDDILHCDPKKIADEDRYMALHYMSPYPWIQPEAATAQAADIYAQAMIDGVEQKRRRFLRRFLEELDKIIQKKNAPIPSEVPNGQIGPEIGAGPVPGAPEPVPSGGSPAGAPAGPADLGAADVGPGDSPVL